MSQSVGFLYVVITVISCYICYYFLKKQNKKTQEEIAKDVLERSQAVKVPAPKKLELHSKEFEKGILNVEDRIHVAIGYGLANSIFIEGEKSCVLIDVQDSRFSMKQILDDFQYLLERKPIEAVILTHFHADHTMGLSSVEKMYPKVKIYAHERFHEHYQQVLSLRAPITGKRAKFQFGPLIPDWHHVNSGIGLKLNSDFGFPEKIEEHALVKDILRVKFDDTLELDLIHAPGETPDQLVVWWPKKKVLFPADNIYKAFPNLYAIRGTMSRDSLIWVQTLDKMIGLNAECMVPQHTRPLYGKETIRDTLNAYRDAVQFVHDQTYRMMNQGKDPIDIARSLKLPPNLANHPYLQEFYGTVEWSSRAVFSHYLGWFSGRTSDLHTIDKLEKSKMIIRLAKGGEDEVLEKAEEAFEEEKLKWGLMLVDAIIFGTEKISFIEKAKALKVKILRGLASKEVSANGRNWFLTSALEVEGLDVNVYNVVKVLIKYLPMTTIFNAMIVRVIPEKCCQVKELVHFHFEDTNVDYILRLNKGVLSVSKELPSPRDVITLQVWTSEVVWRDILAKDRNPLWAWMTGQLKVRPFITKLSKFVSYFDIE